MRYYEYTLRPRVNIGAWTGDIVLTQLVDDDLPPLALDSDIPSRWVLTLTGLLDVEIEAPDMVQPIAEAIAGVFVQAPGVGTCTNRDIRVEIWRGLVWAMLESEGRYVTRD